MQYPADMEVTYSSHIHIELQDTLADLCHSVHLCFVLVNIVILFNLILLIIYIVMQYSVVLFKFVHCYLPI